MSEAAVNKPPLELVGRDGNAFAILGRARRAARKAGWSEERWEEFYEEATSRDYDHLLGTVMEWFDTDPPESRQWHCLECGRRMTQPEAERIVNGTDRCECGGADVDLHVPARREDGENDE